MVHCGCKQGTKESKLVGCNYDSTYSQMTRHQQLHISIVGNVLDVSWTCPDVLYFGSEHLIVGTPAYQ